jgi:primosomal protein N' (replication factor Y)
VTLALLRAQRSSLPVVLGSATPSLESLERVEEHKAVALLLPQRATGAAAPALHLIDLRRHAATQGIATPTLAAIERHLGAGRSGPALSEPPRLRTDAVLPGLRLVRGVRPLRCAVDGAPARALAALPSLRLEQPIPEVCAVCGQPAKPVGQGTERIEETLQLLLPDVPLVRIDRDAIRRKGMLEDALASVHAGTARVLVGTQMLTKGHDFPNVSLVVVLNADQGLFGTDFRASERLAQTIVQVAGRAGRAGRPGEVLIQTEFPEHPLLRQLVDKGYDAFAVAALAERRQARWPPYARLAVLRAEASRRELPHAFLERALEVAPARDSADVELLGPAWAPMERRAGHYRAQLLAHAITQHRCSDCWRAGSRPSRRCLKRAGCAGRLTSIRWNFSERRSARLMQRSQFLRCQLAVVVGIEAAETFSELRERDLCFRQVERVVAILVGRLELLAQVVAMVTAPVVARGLHLGRCQRAVLVGVEARETLAMRGDALSASAREILPSLSVSAAFQCSPA